MCQSPRNFFNHLKGNLIKSGFARSLPVLYRQSSLCSLRRRLSLLLERSKGYRRLHQAYPRYRYGPWSRSGCSWIPRYLNPTYRQRSRMIQSGLIDRVVTAVGLDDANHKLSAAPKKPLGRDLAGSPFSQDFNYASVVDMMMYLCDNSRPDIAFAVSQCARYTHNPTELHGMYLKHIGKYLKGTRDKGIILKPSKSSKLDIECYIDADYAGLWNAEDEQDPHCVRSRTGFVILVAGCPVLWKSKLQTEIALSTMESEYIALSQSCRGLLPLQDLVKEVGAIVGMPEGDKTMRVRSTVYKRQ